jgi:hypothetical protein
VNHREFAVVHITQDLQRYSLENKYLGRGIFSCSKKPLPLIYLQNKYYSPTILTSTVNIFHRNAKQMLTIYMIIKSLVTLLFYRLISLLQNI